MRATLRNLLVTAVLCSVSSTMVACDDGPTSDLLRLPQIVPHINPINACELFVGNDDYPAQHWTFDLMLRNEGREQLEIEDIEVLHDRNCAFSGTNGDVRIWDNDRDDDFLATARSLDAAIMRIEYTPTGVGEDEIEILVHSNAENFPELPIYVCAAGTASTTLTCSIRVDPACTSSSAVCFSNDECAGDEQCVRTEMGSQEGTCQCRPCGLPPEESWEDCSEE